MDTWLGIPDQLLRIYAKLGSSFGTSSPTTLKDPGIHDSSGGKKTIKGGVLYSHHVLLHDGKAAHNLAAAICMPHCRKRRA
jgi:hypothetical protein